MKLGPETKLDKRNATTSKNFLDDVVPANYDVIVIIVIAVIVMLTFCEIKC